MTGISLWQRFLNSRVTVTAKGASDLVLVIQIQKALPTLVTIMLQSFLLPIIP